MHYLFIGYYVDEKIFDLILEKKINNMSVARQKFEYNLIRGLSSQLGENIDFVSYVPTDGNLDIPKQSYIGDAKIEHIPIEKGKLKSIFYAGKKFEQYLLDICKKNSNELRIIMYAVNPLFEHYLLKYKKKYGIKMITVCSEVPKLRRFKRSLQSEIKKKIYTWYNEKFDGYIFFSEEMKKIVKYQNKPTMVLEGIAPEILKEPVIKKKNIVMYAGGLASDNKIPELLGYCTEIEEISEIWICGNGPDEKRVKEISLTDSRIKYFGRLSNERVLELEEKAKILINFRSPDEELTKYSFPSKILEYISSGSLVLSTKLLGIPSEYFDYIIPIDYIDKEKIKETLRKSLQLKDEQYLAYCKHAQEFIKNKNYYFQSKKIIEFTNEL